MTTGRKVWLAASLAALTTGGPAVIGMASPGPDPAPIVIARNLSGSYLGVGVVELTGERAKALNLHEEQGVEITRVEDESPAEKAGLKTGDVVLEYNGQRVEGVEQFMRLVRETPPGRDVKLAVTRGGTQQQVALKTGSRKQALSSRVNGEQVIEIPRIELPSVRMPDVPQALMSWRSSVLGVEAEALDSQLAEFFGVKEGVLVRSVVKGSSAERAGLKAGDVIVKIDDTRVASPREISSAVRNSKSSRKSVMVNAVRDKREMSFSVPLDDAEGELNHAMPRPRVRN